MRTLTVAVLGVLVSTLVTCGMVQSISNPFADTECEVSPTPFIACASGRDSTCLSARTAASPAEKVLVIAMDSDIETMDPAKTSAMYGPPGMIYETLISRDLDGAYRPGLAEWWNLNTDDPDHPTFEIRLQQGVTFHDGTPFNTEAVTEIINYYAQDDSWVQYEFWAVYGCQNKSGWPEQGIWCKDDYNMVLNLTWADVALQFNLSHLYGSMIWPGALDEGFATYGTAVGSVIGTGPFMLDEWVPGDHVTLVKNPDYSWGASWYVNKGPATIDRIIYRVIADQAARFAGFESGAIDVLQQVPPNKVPTYQADTEAYTVITGPGQGTYHVEFNCQKDPWTSPDLRRAFGYAIDRAAILDIIWHGIGEEGVNYLPPLEPESTKVPAEYNFTYDVGRAMELFSLGNYEDTDSDAWLENLTDGEELTLNLWTATKGEDISMSMMLVSQFEAVGVHVDITEYPEEELRAMAAAGEQDAILFWYSWPRAEILDWLFGTWAAGGSNTAWYMDPVFDDYVTNWTYAETEEEFSDNATLAHIRLLTQGPWAPILYWHQIDAVHNKVSGWYAHPFGREQVFNILDVDVSMSPTALASVTPNPATAGETVTFDGTGSSDDEEIVNWTWEFTDGGSPVELWGEIATYVFEDEFQTVEVTLTVRDSDGYADSVTVTLEILGAIPEFPTLAIPLIAMVTVFALIRLARRGRSGVD